MTDRVLHLVRASMRCTAALALGVSALAAQAAPASDSAKRRETLFTLTDAGIAVGFAGATVALFSVDRAMAIRIRGGDAFPGRTVNQWATAFDYLALPGVFVMSVGAYTWGRVGKHPDMADFGWHTAEAAMVGAVVTEALKVTVGRSRPYVSLDTNPRDFRFGGGLTSGARQSFPSGHSTIAFAAASAATSEIQRLWPRAAWPAGILLYGSAVTVGVARMYQNQHWASDVVLGAGIGTFAGLKTVRYAHLHEQTLFDRILLGTTIGPDGRGGAMVAWSSPFPR